MTRIAKKVTTGEIWDKVKLENGLQDICISKLSERITAKCKQNKYQYL